MKILLCDYNLSDAGENEREYFAKYLPDAEFLVYSYENDQALIEKLADVDILLTCFLNVSAYIIDNSPKLKMISIDATGYGNIDIEAAKRNGVLVASQGEYCTMEVADHTMALMLALIKNLKPYDKLSLEGSYSFRSIPSRKSISSMTLAIVGYGRIGKAVAKRALAFGMNVLAVTRHAEMYGQRDEYVKYVSMDEAAKCADVISNHMNQTPENEDYFNHALFCKMKKGVIFINVGRGAGVNEDDLLAALDEGIISAAGLDVLKETKPDFRYLQRFTRDNVIITPHSAFYSDEVMNFLKYATAKNVVCFLEGRLDEITNIVV